MQFESDTRYKHSISTENSSCTSKKPTREASNVYLFWQELILSLRTLPILESVYLETQVSAQYCLKYNLKFQNITDN